MLHAPKEISAAKHARRLHRKRVAHIVTQRWLQFAEGRLRAFRHHRRKLQLASFAGFLQAVQTAQRVQRDAAVLRSKIKCQRLRLRLLCWGHCVRRLRINRTLVNQARIRAASSALQHAWSAWQSYVQRQRSKQRLIAKSEFFRGFLVASNALQAWRAWVAASRRKACLRARAAQHHRRVSTYAALGAWRALALCLGEARRAAAARMCMHVAHRQRAALQAWADVAKQTSHARQRLCACLAGIATSLLRRCTAAALHQWACVTAEKRWLARAAATVQIEVASGLQRQACHRYRSGSH